MIIFMAFILINLFLFCEFWLLFFFKDHDTCFKVGQIDKIKNFYNLFFMIYIFPFSYQCIHFCYTYVGM